MQDNTDQKSFIINLESDTDDVVQVKINSRMHRRCPAISAIPPGAVVRGVQPESFHAIISYLDGVSSLSDFTNHIGSNEFLLFFTQTWVLAARLGLPILQNELMANMISIYASLVDRGGTDLELKYTADESLPHAFQHLRDQIGRNSHAESFLICFTGRTAPLICELERKLNLGRIDCAIRNEILAEARSFGVDSIKYQPQVFLVDPEKPPKYPPLEIQSKKIGLASAPLTPSGAPHSTKLDEADTLQVHGEPGSNVRKQPSLVLIPQYPRQRPRSPYPVIPRPRSPLPNWSYDAFGLKVHMQPGDTDDPGPWGTSQAVDFEHPSGVLHLKGRGDADGRGSERPPSLPSLPSLHLLPSRLPASPPTYSSLQPPFDGHHDHETRMPCIIQIMQHNNNAHDNANRIHNGDNNIAIAQAQDHGVCRKGTARAVANSGGGHSSYKLVRDKKGKRCKWFSLLTWGSKHY